MTSKTRRLAVGLAAALLAAGAAAVDVFSPGELAKPHAHLEGLASCTRCHPAGQQLSRGRCADCHKDVGERVARNAGFHGRVAEAERDCWRCHHDHQGRDFPLVDWGEGGVEAFDHEKSGWSLLGKHRKVKCEKCHDPRYVKEPAVLEAMKKGRRTYLGAPAACDSTCHKDPHENRLGPRCDACHTAEGWSVLTQAAKEDQTLHDKTRYPLRGAHARVACKPCHGPAVPGEPPRWRGLPFAACADCHPDTHLGQLAEPRCERCHGLEAFLPPRYGVEEHAKARYPLEGGHRAVACSRCHPKDARLAERVSAETVAALAAVERKPHFSQALLAVAGDLARCETCHADPHGGQLAPKACAACHEVSSFRKLRFDHAKDSRYPLDGKHAKAVCGSCHRPEHNAVVRWKPLPLACEGCHADPHAGTLFEAKAARCERCHDARSWKETRFRHEPPFTQYRLEGKHEKVKCERCHPAAKLAGGQAVKYRGVPRECAGCHVDPHKGALRAYATEAGATAGATSNATRTSTSTTTATPTSTRTSTSTPTSTPTPTPTPTSTSTSTSGAKLAAAQTRCEGCHDLQGWAPKPFVHERTGFTLVGAHVRVPCRSCHGEDLARPQPRGCAGCHRDPHQGRLGGRCRECHDETLGWRASFDANAHRKTSFPLEGRHALVPCEECHGDRLSPGFARPTPACVSCHEPDRQRTAALGPVLDHVAGEFPLRCQDCHSPWRFRGAFIPQHEACFGIASGNHAGIRCFDCHDSAVEPVGTSDWSCAPDTSHCERCHGSEQGPTDALAPQWRQR